MKRIFISLVLAGVLIAPLSSLAAAPFSYGAWIPFWKKTAGTQEFTERIGKFREVSPFSYEVNADGTLKDSVKLTAGFWPDWFANARILNVKIIPTVAWINGPGIYAMLSNKILRTAHEKNIVTLAKTQKYDGIDIDYENKTADTKPYFSAFIKELSIKLHAAKKTLSCTIEPRTPVASRFVTPPTDLAFANDYVVLNKYCDEVRIMAYDQGTIDLLLNASKGAAQMYMPVADPDWVKKVLLEAMKTISAKKIVLAVPTYGYEYQVQASTSTGQVSYQRVRAVTFVTAMARALSTNSQPIRNSSGELSYTYTTSTVVTVPPSLNYTATSTVGAQLLNDAPFSDPSSSITTPTTVSVTRLVEFTDAVAILQKINLAKQLKLRGVVFFKMDGDTDPSLWSSI